VPARTVQDGYGHSLVHVGGHEERGLPDPRRGTYVRIRRTWLWFTRGVFIGTEMRLGVGFNAAQARLANLAHGGVMRHASDEAYGKWGADLARVGPLGTAPGVSRLVKVQFRDMVIHEDSAVWTLRWEAIGTTGALFPVLDADITLTPAGDHETVLVVRGAYRPPLGNVGATLNRPVMHRIAEATIRAFTRQIGDAIVNPAASPEARHAGMEPEISYRPEADTT
jgi:hypothetical protein